MNRIILLAIMSILLGFSAQLSAQSSAVDRYYQDYREDGRFTSITVSSKMFSLFVNFEMDDPDEQELVETISKLKGLKMLVGGEMEDVKSAFSQARHQPALEMEELMSITDADREFVFYITEANGSISELLMVGHENQQMLIISLVGDISLKQIAALSRKMDLEGFEHFENVEK